MDAVRANPAFRVVRAAAIGAMREYYSMRSGRARHIVVYHAHPDFERKGDAIADVLASRGLPVERRSGYSSRLFAEMESSNDLWVGFWNEFPPERLPRRYVFYNAEPLAVARWGESDEWIGAMRGARHVWDYSRSNDAILAAKGITHTHVPFGYAPYYERIFAQHTGTASREQDIDVLFVGSESERRMHMLDRLRARGLTVHAATRENPAHGAELDRLFARTRILLGIHWHDEALAQVADYARLDQLLSNRVFVIQETPRAGVSPEFEEVVTTCDYDDMPDTCIRLLADPAERARRAEAAYEWFSREMHFDRFIPYAQIERDLTSE